MADNPGRGASRRRRRVIPASLRPIKRRATSSLNVRIAAATPRHPSPPHLHKQGFSLKWGGGGGEVCLCHSQYRTAADRCNTTRPTNSTLSDPDRVMSTGRSVVVNFKLMLHPRARARSQNNRSKLPKTIPAAMHLVDKTINGWIQLSRLRFSQVLL